jgi:hypothetical protein
VRNCGIEKSNRIAYMELDTVAPSGSFGYKGRPSFLPE